MTAPADASVRSKSFRAVKATDHALIFKVRGVPAANVISAHAKLRRGGPRRDLRRPLRVQRVRGALNRKRRLRIHKPKSVANGRLRVKLGQGKKPKPPNPAPSSCNLDLGALAAAGCTTLFEDTGDGNAAALWGKVDCQSEARHQVVSSGDPLRMASGVNQPTGQARQLSVLDGDDVWGKRCELGENWRPSTPMPVYEEGQRRITFISFRLPSTFPLATREWQAVMQMKQTQPAANGGGTPVLSLKANKGQWSLWQSDSSGPSESSHSLWSAPASADRWTRFAFDVTYSRNPQVGAITVYVDLNGDGDAADAGEQSPTFRTYTLKTETTGGRADDGVAPGESIASHLRTGVYQSPSITCPAATGCASQVDNVQIVAPGA